MKLLPDKVKRSEMVILTVKEEIEAKQKENYTAFVNTLKAD